MRTFLWFRENKAGLPLESLVIYYGSTNAASRSNPWVVHEMGERRWYTTGAGETVLWEMDSESGFRELERMSNREDDVRSESFTDRWERLDPVGFVVPIGWP